ncbi:MAG: DUF3574 domain-containing protein [Alphaproteobacteria bacterium]|nr:DUF3574 domain-containing protein [Alphaproteobacteria bacterium]MDE2629413.1 DUF3574 domain-containing protein [Alphaproteobacteria bacterium]
MFDCRDGFAASGKVRGCDGVVVREASRHLIAILPDASHDADKLVAIREVYKQRFLLSAGQGKLNAGPSP